MITSVQSRAMPTFLLLAVLGLFAWRYSINPTSRRALPSAASGSRRLQDTLDIEGDIDGGDARLAVAGDSLVADKANPRTTDTHEIESDLEIESDSFMPSEGGVEGLPPDLSPISLLPPAAGMAAASLDVRKNCGVSATSGGWDTCFYPFTQRLPPRRDGQNVTDLLPVPACATVAPLCQGSESNGSTYFANALPELSDDEVAGFCARQTARFDLALLRASQGPPIWSEEHPRTIDASHVNVWWRDHKRICEASAAVCAAGLGGISSLNARWDERTMRACPSLIKRTYYSWNHHPFESKIHLGRYNGHYGDNMAIVMAAVELVANGGYAAMVMESDVSFDEDTREHPGLHGAQEKWHRQGR